MIPRAESASTTFSDGRSALVTCLRGHATRKPATRSRGISVKYNRGGANSSGSFSPFLEAEGALS